MTQKIYCPRQEGQSWPSSAFLPVGHSRGGCVDLSRYVLLMEPEVQPPLAHVIPQSLDVLRISWIAGFLGVER